eukprot:sb/3475217/
MTFIVKRSEKRDEIDNYRVESSGHEFSKENISLQEPTHTSKQPIRTRYLGHVTGYQPIRDQYFLIRSVPEDMTYSVLQRSSSNDPTSSYPHLPVISSLFLPLLPFFIGGLGSKLAVIIIRMESHLGGGV